MSVISKASLVQIPSGYGEDKLYSEVPNTTAGDFTFTRASTGTRVNSDGYIEEVPCNLLTYSEDYLSGFWSKSNTTIIANDIISPRGLQDASKIYPNSSGNYRHIRNALFSQSSGLETFSIYAKAGELNHLVLIDYDGSGIGVDFDLTNGVATDNATSPFDSFSMTDVGDGWYRCVATATDMYFYWILSDNGGLSVTANGTDGLYIWGAMINKGTSVKPYIKTTDRLDIPRLDYSGGASCPTLLLEPQRSNLVTYSDFTNSYWTKTRSTIVESGTMLGQTSYNFVSNVGLSGRVSRSGFPLDGQEYHKSVYVKYNGVRFVYFGNGNPSNSFEVIVFDFTTESITYEGSRIGRSSVTDMGNGIFRIVWTTPNSNSTARNRFTIGFSSSATTFNDYVGDGVQGVLITSPQYEQGSFETSYIPSTSGTSVTREADVCDNAGDATTFNDTEGVIFFEGSYFEDIIGNVISLSNGSNNDVINFRTDTIGRFKFFVGSNSYLTNFNEYDVSENHKIALLYSTNSFKVFIDGVKKHDTTISFIPSIVYDRLNFSNQVGGTPFYGKCKQLIYFNEALTDSELETLTTI